MLNGHQDRLWWSRLTPAERRQEIRRWARQPPDTTPPEPEPGFWTERDIQDEVEALDAPPALSAAWWYRERQSGSDLLPSLRSGAP